MKKLLCIVAVSFHFLSNVEARQPVTPASSKAQKQKIRYGDMLERARKSIQCLPYGNDLTAYNCVMYQVSP